MTSPVLRSEQRTDANSIFMFQESSHAPHKNNVRNNSRFDGHATNFTGRKFLFPYGDILPSGYIIFRLTLPCRGTRFVSTSVPVTVYWWSDETKKKSRPRSERVEIAQRINGIGWTIGQIICRGGGELLPILNAWAFW
jgi:hypothetical protein